MSNYLPITTHQHDQEALERFYALLDAAPPDAWVLERQGVKYLPIERLEMELDSIFNHQWSMESLPPTVVANEIIYTVHLKCIHPVTGAVIVRSGTGAVPIQQKRGSSPTDYDAKIPNALQKNAPAAMAFAFKNAAQRLGRRFGRDLNRGGEAEYEPMSTKVLKADAQREAAFKAIGEASSRQIKGLFERYKTIPGILEAIINRRKELAAAAPEQPAA